MSPASRLLGDPEQLATRVLAQLALWLLLAAVLWITVAWEKQPLSSLWLAPSAAASLGWGLLLAAGFVLLIFPATERVRSALGLPGYASGAAEFAPLPIWFRIFAVITAGIVEETLFRGYGLTRLAWLTGSVGLASAVSVAVFAAVHLPLWGTGAALSFLMSGALGTAFFVWRRDLLAMIVAHVAIDAWGLVISPTFSTWWAGVR